jgi:hypothetical protein
MEIETEIVGQLQAVKNSLKVLDHVIAEYLKPISLAHVGVYWESGNEAWRVRWKNNKKYHYKTLKQFKHIESKLEAYNYALEVDKIADFVTNTQSK